MLPSDSLDNADDMMLPSIEFSYNIIIFYLLHKASCFFSSLVSDDIVSFCSCIIRIEELDVEILCDPMLPSHCFDNTDDMMLPVI